MQGKEKKMVNGDGIKKRNRRNMQTIRNVHKSQTKKAEKYQIRKVELEKKLSRIRNRWQQGKEKCEQGEQKEKNKEKLTNLNNQKNVDIQRKKKSVDEFEKL